MCIRDRWYREFIQPAQPLSLATIWAFGRGNHETCWNPPFSKDEEYGKSRWFGNAFRYFFSDSDDATAGQSCRELLPTRYFDIGPDKGGNLKNNHRIVFVDNSFGRSHQLKERYQDAIKATGDGSGESRTPHVPSTHWFSHIPELALLRYCRGQCEGSNKDALIKVSEALDAMQWSICTEDADSSCAPSTLFRGHQHFLERITVPDPENANAWVWPQTYIVGHGGTNHDTINRGFQGFCSSSVSLQCSAPGVCSDNAEHDSQTFYNTEVYASYEYGYLLWKRDASIAANPSKYPTGWEPDYVWAGSNHPPVHKKGEPASCGF